MRISAEIEYIFITTRVTMFRRTVKIRLVRISRGNK